MFPRTKRINAHRRLVAVVLAPVHEHLSAAKRSLHFGNDDVGKFAFQFLRARVGERLAPFIGHRRVQGREDLQLL